MAGGTTLLTQLGLPSSIADKIPSEENTDKSIAKDEKELEKGAKPPKLFSKSNLLGELDKFIKTGALQPKTVSLGNTGQFKISKPNANSIMFTKLPALKADKPEEAMNPTKEVSAFLGKGVKSLKGL